MNNQKNYKIYYKIKMYFTLLKDWIYKKNKIKY